MAGTPAENQQRRDNEATRRRHIRASLGQSFQANDDEGNGPAERPIDPQLVEAFGNLWDHEVTQEEFTSFVEEMERKGHERQKVNWDFTRWVARTQQRIIQEMEAEIQNLNGGIQVMDSDLADARKELQEQQSIVRAVVAGSNQTTPAPDQAGKATSKKFPDPSVWKSGTPSE